MATDLVIQRRGQVIFPSSALDLQSLEKLPQREDLAAKIWKPRALPLQRFYRGLVSLVAEAVGERPDELHVRLKIRASLISQVVALDGRFHLVVKSTAFDDMDEIEFRDYVRFAIDVITMEILPGHRETELIKNVKHMIGIEAPRELGYHVKE